MTYKSAQALLRRKGISTGALGWIVNRYHVGMTDADVEADIRQRSGTAQAANLTDAAVAIALKLHHDNQGIYRHVTRGF